MAPRKFHHLKLHALKLTIRNEDHNRRSLGFREAVQPRNDSQKKKIAYHKLSHLARFFRLRKPKLLEPLEELFTALRIKKLGENGNSDSGLLLEESFVTFRPSSYYLDLRRTNLPGTKRLNWSTILLNLSIIFVVWSDVIFAVRAQTSKKVEL